MLSATLCVAARGSAREVLLEEREVPVTQVEHLDLEIAVAKRLLGDPGEYPLGGSGRPGASNDDLQRGQGSLLS